MKYFFQGAITIVFFVGIFFPMEVFIYGQEENISLSVQEDVDIEKNEEIDEKDGGLQEEEMKENKKIYINEIRFTGGTGRTNEDFIEIYNSGKDRVDLKNWSLRKETSENKESSVFSFESSYILEPKSFLLWANERDGYADVLGADIKNKNSIAYKNRIFLQDDEGREVSSYSFEESDYFTSAFDGEVWRWVCNDTPGEENNFLGFEGVKTVHLEELLPDPDTSQQEEFVELYNYGDADVDLSGWFIGDKTTKKALSGILAPGIYRAEHFGISLNNGDEKISLLDRCGGTVDEFEYRDSQKGKSWARDENSWKETPFVTKGEKNIFAKKIENPTIRLNEIFPRPSQEGKESEFVEIYNFGENPVDIRFWSLGDNTTTNRYTFPNQSVLMPREYRVVYGREAPFTLNDQGKETVYLFDPAGFIVESMSYEKPTQDFSFIFSEEDSLWKKTPYRSPKEKNIFPQSQMGATIRLNEILPNPKEDEEKNEYIELYNFGENPVDISFWQIVDVSLQGYIFPQNTLLSAGEYKVLYREEFSFSLNNTKESLSLFDASGYKIDTASWESSKENISKNRDGDELRNSKHLTPGEKNKLNNLPKIKEKDIPKKGYVGVKTLFSIRAEDKDEDDLTYRWEFGNSKKSYREKTSHTYEKKGTHNVTLRVSDGIEEVFISREIFITAYPKFKAKIIALLPNPAGKDTEGEWIEIYNEDGKTLNLIGWSIATGENFEKLTNHPIHKNIQIKPKESAKIYRTQSSFSLRSSSGAIELRQPNKKVSDALSYEKEKILDDEEYRFSSGSWTWVLPYSTSMQEPLQENQELQEEILIQEELVLGSSIEKNRNAFQEIYFFLYENEINFNQKRELSKKENTFIFTRDGVMKNRLWWKRCLWGDCLEG